MKIEIEDEALCAIADGLNTSALQLLMKARVSRLRRDTGPLSSEAVLLAARTSSVRSLERRGLVADKDFGPSAGTWRLLTDLGFAVAGRAVEDRGLGDTVARLVAEGR